MTWVLWIIAAVAFSFALAIVVGTRMSQQHKHYPVKYTGPADEPDPHGIQDDWEMHAVMALSFKTGKACYMSKTKKGWELHLGDKIYSAPTRAECIQRADAEVG